MRLFNLVDDPTLHRDCFTSIYRLIDHLIKSVSAIELIILLENAGSHSPPLFIEQSSIMAIILHPIMVPHSPSHFINLN